LHPTEPPQQLGGLSWSRLSITASNRYLLDSNHRLLDDRFLPGPSQEKPGKSTR
jgi:hypothetical protein